jgi:hypothetical protein
MVRTATFYNYEYYKGLGTDEFDMPVSGIKKHTGHCLDIIRQQLMCASDTGLVSQWWAKDGKGLFGFSNKHMCKNFEDIRKWAEVHQIGEDDLVETRPGDVLLKDENEIPRPIWRNF